MGEWVSLIDLHARHSEWQIREMDRRGFGFYEWLMKSPDASNWTKEDE